AVNDEMTRTRVAAKFMPTVHVRPKEMTAPTDRVLYPPAPAAAPAAAVAGRNVQFTNALSVNEGDTLRINDFFVEFAMTQRQVDDEANPERAMMNGHNA